MVPNEPKKPSTSNKTGTNNMNLSSGFALALPNSQQQAHRQSTDSQSIEQLQMRIKQLEELNQRLEQDSTAFQNELAEQSKNIAKLKRENAQIGQNLIEKADLTKSLRDQTDEYKAKNEELNS